MKSSAHRNYHYNLGSFPEYYITALGFSVPLRQSGGEMVALFALTAVECGDILHEFHNNELL